MQHLLHIIEDLIVTFVTLQWKILYIHKTYYLWQQREGGKIFHIYMSPLSFFELQHYQQFKKEKKERGLFFWFF